MQTPKEALLALIKGEPYDMIPEYYSTVKSLVFPGERWIDMENFDPYGTGPDMWGVLWTNRGPNPMVDGNMVAKDFKLFDSMEDWKDHVKFPPIDYVPVGDILNGMKMSMGYNEEENILEVLLLSGAFERMNEMIGMEEALTAFYEYPDEVHEFFEKMCEYKLHCIDLAFEAVHPDGIYMHDDWGQNSNMFFSPEIWREFIKPLEKRYADHIHELGMFYHHHSCGYIMQIIPDLVEIGVDVIDPMMVENDVKGVIEQYGDKITFAGGINNRIIDGPNTTPEERYAEVERAFKEYAPIGKRWFPFYIPAVTERFEEYIGNVYKVTGSVQNGDWNLWKVLDE